MREDINVKGADIELDAWLISVLCQGSRVQFPAGDLKEFYKYIYISKCISFQQSYLLHAPVFTKATVFVALIVSTSGSA